MGLPVYDNNESYKELRRHIGHNIVCVGYGIAIECKNCSEVLIDFNHPEVEELAQ